MNSGERFDIGRVMARTFGVIGRHFASFTAVSLIFAGGPTLALEVVDYGDLTLAANWPNAEWIWDLVSYGIVYFVLAGVGQAGLVVATLQDLDGRVVDMRACVGQALLLLLPLTGLSILVASAVGVGLVLLIVPGVLLYVTWFVAVPALVLERCGIRAATLRSAALTNGARWSVLGLGVVLFILVAIVEGAANFGGSFAFGKMGAAVLPAVSAMFSFIVFAVGSAVAYAELRTIEEGSSVDALADVFA